MAIDCTKHKKKTICAIKGCKNKTASRGTCPVCGIHRVRTYCKRHRADGTKKRRSGRKNKSLPK